MRGRSRISSEITGGAMLDVASSIRAVQIHQILSGYLGYTLKLSELKDLILEQLSSNPKTMQEIAKCLSSCTVDPENPGMLRFPSRTSLDIYDVPKWPHMKVVHVGPRRTGSGWGGDDEPAEDYEPWPHLAPQRSMSDFVAGLQSWMR